MAPLSRFNSQRLLNPLAAFVLVVAALYFGKPILLPLVLSILLTFLLSPIVLSLHRFGLGRTPAVIVTVAVTACLLGALGWVVILQLNALAQNLPAYRHNIRQKVVALRGLQKDSAIEKVQETVEEVSEELNKTSEEVEQASQKFMGRNNASSPWKGWRLPVIVEADKPIFGMGALPAALQPFLAPLASFGIAIVLVIFMLIRREDLRNRILRLLGDDRITLTTKVIDETDSRIGRYLLMQLLINASFGFAVGIGLFLIGIPYATLWGLMAAVLRYIPYVGPWVAATLPILLSVVASPGWTAPILVIGLFLVLELLSNNLMEPMLYRRSVGVSEVALLVSATFWAWLWGPLGLVLSTPIAVCLVVLGKNVPQLQCFYVLLGDEPALDPPLRYYQRLLAEDHWEAKKLLKEELDASSLGEVCDRLLLPVLVLAQEEYERGALTEQEQRNIIRSIREDFSTIESKPETLEAAVHEASPSSSMLVYGCPAHDEADQLALVLLASLLDEEKCALELGSPEMLCSEVLQHVEQKKPDLVCIASLPPGGLAQARYLCRRLRQQFPELMIVVGRWGLEGDAKEVQEQFASQGMDRVGFSFAETVRQITQWSQFLGHRTRAHTPDDVDGDADSPIASTPVEHVG